MTTGILLSQAIEGFLLARAADGYSPSTLSQYKWGLDFVTSEISKPVKEVTTVDLRRAMAKVQASDLSPVSIFHVWKAIRAFYKWSSAEGLTERPDKPLAQPRFSIPEVVPFTSDEIKTLLKAVDYSVRAVTKKRASFVMAKPNALRDRAIILVLLDTGLRASELCRLRIDDIDLQNGSVIVRPFRSGLKSRSRTIPIGQTTRKVLWKYFSSRETRPADPAFSTLEGGELDRGDLGHLFQRLGIHTGIKNVHPHRFRHTFAITYLRNGGDVFTLQRLLGHSTLEMVRHYVALAEADDKEAHRRASPVDNWRL